MRFTFRSQERLDLVKSWLAVSVAFAIVMVGLSFSPGWLATFLSALAIAAVTAGIGFLLHELAHKWMANRHECHAEYRADNTMLIVALVTSIFGIVIAAPGAVHISGHPGPRERGITSLAGPATNLLLALLFLALYFALPAGWLQMAAGFGSVINTWLGLFNMIPFGLFDGAKVLAWDKWAYGITVGIAVILAFIQVPLGLF